MLNGKRVYVVEDEAIVAMEMQQILEDAGATVSIFREAGEFGEHHLSSTDLVLFDARLGAKPVVEFAARLRAAGLPMVVASADSGIGTLFPDAVPLAKPFFGQTLIEACERALEALPAATQRGVTR